MDMMRKTLGFLRSLRRHNDREWFNAHKEEYLQIKAYVDELAARLIAEVAKVDSRASGLTPADCTYRIYRDTRFSPDKTPYKTHIGIFINPPGGKKSMTCGYYLHIEPDDCMFAAGTICLPSPLVKAIRKSIYDEIDEFRSIVEDEDFRKLFTNLGANLVKTAPQGIPRDWEFIEYVKPRDFLANAPLTDDFLLGGDLAEKLAPYIAQAKRFNDFINYTIEEYMGL